MNTSHLHNEGVARKETNSPGSFNHWNWGKGEKKPEKQSKGLEHSKDFYAPKRPFKSSLGS